MSRLWITLVELLGVVHGTPLPKEVLGYQSSDGHKIELNNTEQLANRLEPFDMRIDFDGFPVGIIAPDGGMLLGSDQLGEAEEGLIEWAKQKIRELEAAKN